MSEGARRQHQDKSGAATQAAPLLLFMRNIIKPIDFHMLARTAEAAALLILQERERQEQGGASKNHCQRREQRG